MIGLLGMVLAAFSIHYIAGWAGVLLLVGLLLVMNS